MKDKVEYVRDKVKAGEFTVLPETIAIGKVYKISRGDSLKKNGIENGFLFIPKGSGIKEHRHTDDIEFYTLVCGSLSVCGKKQDLNVCLIGDKHNIDVVDEDTIIETKKISKNKIINDSWNRGTKGKSI